MGNKIDKRAIFDGGYLFVKTERPFYYPGELVIGKIYIRLNTQMSATNLELRVKGKEKYWYDERSVGHDSSSSDDEVEYKRKFLEFKGIVFTFSQLLMPGDYTIQFEFTLPVDLPGSVCYRNDHNN